MEASVPASPEPSAPPIEPERSASPCLLIEELARVCAQRPLDEKVLLSPSLRVGYQIHERLARQIGAVIHLRVETVATLALAAAGPALAREGARLLSRAQALALIEQACGEALTEGSYFGPLKDRPGFHRAIQSALEELRAAGLTPAALPISAFTDPRKPRELRRILESYGTALERGRWVDRAEVLRRAAELGSQQASGPVYIVPEGLELSAVERRFLERLTDERRIAVRTDDPKTWTRRARGARIFRASGEENEIRAVFREVLAMGLPFDEVEIIHTDTTTYPALAFELASEHGIPATFSGGIAVSFTWPGQAALAYLGWIEEGFQAESLREALASGVLSFPREMSSRIGPLAAARELRRAAIGWGRERHLSSIDRLAAEITYRRPRTDDDEDPAARKARRDRRLATIATARLFVARALSLAPAGPTADLATLARGARAFVSEFAHIRGDLDAAGAAALGKLFEEFQSLPGRPTPLETAAGRLKEAVRALHASPDRPRSGRIHVADLRAGGFSGRRHTFLVGLDERRHPGAGREDPVLSDDERREINALSSAALPLSPDRSRDNDLALKTCVARLRGTVTFGYTGWNLRDLANPGEIFPSPFLLEVHRLGAEELEADYGHLAARTSEGEGFVPSAERALDETEWWLARVGDLRGAERQASVARLHPWLADGLSAERERRSAGLTPWEGVFRSPAPELDPRLNGRPMSASRIQQLADCPFGYFLVHVLKLAPPEEAEEKGTEWLDARSVGSLIHRVFRRFLEDVSSRRKRPSYPGDLPAIQSVAEEELAAMRRRIPPRSELAFARRCEEVRFACRTFLTSESARSDEVEPVAFEVSFGIADEERPSDFLDPVEIFLGEGRSFKLRGSIDRIDRDLKGRFHLWDYKTGASMYTREERGIAGGRQIQPALYSLAWEALAARRGEESASIAASGYFFPGRRGLGERFAIEHSHEETRSTLDALFDMLAAGAFPHTPDKDSDCFACRDLPAFCPDREEAGRTSRTKLSVSEDPLLKLWGKLRGL